MGAKVRKNMFWSEDDSPAVIKMFVRGATAKTGTHFLNGDPIKFDF